MPGLTPLAAEDAWATLLKLTSAQASAPPRSLTTCRKH